MELTEADTDSSSKSYTEIFDAQFPFYLSLGMSATEYWEGDNALPYFYREMWKMKQKQRNDHENMLAWLQGQYIAEAISACFSKNHRYPKEPYKMEEPVKVPKNKEEEQKIVHEAAAGFAAFVATKNAEFRKKNPKAETSDVENNLQKNN